MEPLDHVQRAVDARGHARGRDDAAGIHEATAGDEARRVRERVVDQAGAERRGADAQQWAREDREWEQEQADWAREQDQWRQREERWRRTQREHDNWSVLQQPDSRRNRDRARAAGADAAALAAVEEGDPPELADPRLRAMLCFTRALILSPIDADRALLGTLPAAGISTPAIVTLAQLIAFLSYQTRLVAGLGAMRAARVAIGPETSP